VLEPIIRLILFLKKGKKNKASFFLLYCWLELFCAIFGGRVYLRHLDLIPPLSSLNPFPDEIETEKEGRQKKNRQLIEDQTCCGSDKRVSCNQNWDGYVAGCCRQITKRTAPILFL
jgi:hypothetical protein